MPTYPPESPLFTIISFQIFDHSQKERLHLHARLPALALHVLVVARLVRQATVRDDRDAEDRDRHVARTITSGTVDMAGRIAADVLEITVLGLRFERRARAADINAVLEFDVLLLGDGRGLAISALS